MRWGALGAMVLLSACTAQNFVPGPGVSSARLGPDTEQCRLLAQDVSPSFATNAVSEDATFDDCMQTRGWRLANAAAEGGAVTVATNAPAAPRRALGVRVLPAADMAAYAAQLKPPRGLVVTSVEPSGAAAEAGMATGDVLLGFGGGAFMTPGDLQAALAAVPAGGTVTATIWRDTAQSVVQLQF
jgi:S1-C subfamily serine protease